MRDIILQLVGKPYKLGSTSDEYIDCYNLLERYVKGVTGSGIPNKFGSLTLDNYSDLYCYDKEYVISEFESFMENTFVQTSPLKRTAGDILVITSENSHPAVAIDCGAATCLIVNMDQGSVYVPISSYTIKRCYKCHLLSH